MTKRSSSWAQNVGNTSCITRSRLSNAYAWDQNWETLIANFLCLFDIVAG